MLGAGRGETKARSPQGFVPQADDCGQIYPPQQKSSLRQMKERVRQGPRHAWPPPSLRRQPCLPCNMQFSAGFVLWVWSFGRLPGFLLTTPPAVTPSCERQGTARRQVSVCKEVDWPSPVVTELVSDRAALCAKPFAATELCPSGFSNLRVVF